MTTSNFATYPQTNTGNTYARNVGRAALEFLNALLAVKPAQRATAPTKAVISEGSTTTADLRKLYRLSVGTDSVRPEVIAALRTIAARN